MNDTNENKGVTLELGKVTIERYEKCENIIIQIRKVVVQRRNGQI